MTTTTPRRVRQLNLYTVTADGMPVAQCEAISQADAVALYLAAQQHPTMSARLATPREARALAHLPLYSRQGSPAAAEPEPERDPRTTDMFNDAELIASETPDDEFAAAVQALPTLAEAVADIVGADHVEDGRKMVEEDAAEPMGEPVSAAPAMPGCSASAQAGAAPSDAPATTGDSLWNDANALTAADLCAAHARGRSARAAGLTLDDEPDDLPGWTMRKHWREGWQAENRDMANEALGIVRERWGEKAGEEKQADTELQRQASAAAERQANHVAAKYRDPETGQTWSGRGLKPRWLVAAIDAGRSLDDFLITE